MNDEVNDNDDNKQMIRDYVHGEEQHKAFQNVPFLMWEYCISLCIVLLLLLVICMKLIDMECLFHHLFNSNE